jgi:hypothetical protein
MKYIGTYPAPADISDINGMKTYLDQLYKALLENDARRSQASGGMVYMANRPPTDSEGQDGDLWIEYSI